MLGGMETITAATTPEQLMDGFSRQVMDALRTADPTIAADPEVWADATMKAVIDGLPAYFRQLQADGHAALVWQTLRHFAPKDGRTPGYRYRITFWTKHTRRGERAWYWSMEAHRAMPLPIGDALMYEAAACADRVCCNPWQPRHNCEGAKGNPRV